MNNTTINSSISAACVFGYAAYSVYLHKSNSSKNLISKLAAGILLAGGAYVANIAFNRSVTRSSESTLPENAYSLAQGLVYLHDAGILEMPGTREALLACPEKATSIATGLRILNILGILTQDNIKYLLESPKNALELAYGLRILHEYGIHEMPGTREVLLESPKNSVELAKGLRRLHQADILEVPGTREALLANPEKATDAAEGLVALHQDGLLTEENLNIITRVLKNAPKLILALLALHDDHISTQENFNALTGDLEKTKFLVEGIEFLREVELSYWNPLVTQENFKYLLIYPENAEYLAKGLYALFQHNILTEPNRKELLRGNGAHAMALVNHLKKPDISLDQERFNLTMDIVWGPKPAIPLDQARFDRIMKSVWAPRRLATKMFAMRNKLLAQEKYLPWNVINLISANLAPPYDSEPFDVRGTIETVELQRIREATTLQERDKVPL